MSTTPSNMLLLITDQHSVGALGCYGNTVVRTPNLDRLAAEGARYRNFFTPTAICTPARASLLTGLHPFRHRLLANAEWNTASAEDLDPSLPAYSRELRAAGYNVGHVGKWHAGKQLGPDAYGYDAIHFPGALNPTTHPAYLDWLATNGLPAPNVVDPVRGRFGDGSPGHLLAGRLDQSVDATFEKFLTDRALDRLAAYLADHRTTGRPFHLAVHYYGPHLPYLLPDEYFDLYDPADVELPASMAETFAGKPPVQRHYSDYWTVDSFSDDEWRKLIAVYWGYITMIDEQIGRVLDTLDAADTDGDVHDHTVVAFTADHGEFTGAHRLNDKGPAMYDDIYRIPLLVRTPQVEPGTTVDDFATLTDLAPTIRALAGLPAVEPCDGTPLRFADPAAPVRREVVAEFHGHHFPYPQRMLRTEQHKLVFNPESVNELYDLVRDPHELNNVYTVPTYHEIRTELTHRLYDELLRRGDAFYKWMRFSGDLDRSGVTNSTGIPSIDGWELER